MELLNFIDGKFVASHSANIFSKYSPFDGSLLAHVTSSDSLDVVFALQAAKKARVDWCTQPFEIRSKLLNDLADFLAKNIEEFSFLEALYQGLPQAFSKENNVQIAIRNLRETASSNPMPHEKSTLLEPTGIIGIVTPWCLSLRLVVERLAPAIAAGNVCILKASELSPITSLILAKAFIAVQAPPGIVGILNGNWEVAKVIAGHPSIHALSGVGRSATLRSLNESAAVNFKKIQLSGGAKNSCIVLPDFDFQSRISELLESFLIGQGQLCWNSHRIFIPEDNRDQFIEIAKSYLSSLSPLESPSGHGVWTPLISRELISQVQNHIVEARKDQGKLVFGDAIYDGEGFYFQTTLVKDLSRCSVLQQEELHGPLIIVDSYKYLHEVPKWANNNDYGHSAVIWGAEEKATRLASKLDCGRAGINCWGVKDWRPYFGHKLTSFGNIDNSWSGSFYSDVKTLSFS
jgi:acyl-CoA reductase-like NAD-dependent aldehyde dehydrogenase